MDLNGNRVVLIVVGLNNKEFKANELVEKMRGNLSQQLQCCEYCRYDIIKPNVVTMMLSAANVLQLPSSLILSPQRWAYHTL
jgi:hypothetical protein